MIPNLSPWLLILIAAVNSTIGNICLKKSQLGVPSANFISTLFTTNFIFGLFFYGINVLLFAKALGKLPVSIAYPALSVLSFCFLFIGSSFFLGEKLTGAQMTGLLLVILGILMLGLSDRNYG